MTGPLFRVGIASDARVPALRLVGELDLDGTVPLRSALADAFAQRPDRVVLDLTDLHFCDCAGFNVLLEAKAAADRIGIELSLDGIRPQVARLLTLLGTDALFAERVPPFAPGNV